jgi:DNA replication protein DnaC
MSTTQVCPQCGGSGWKHLPLAPSSKEKPGNAQVARCDCRIGVRAERLLTNARVPARYEHCTFENFDADTPNVHPSLAKAKLAAMRFVEEYPVDRTGLLFIGPIGVGKTHLAVAVIQELVREKGVSAIYYDYRELLKQIQNSYNPSVQATELDILRPVFESEILVLDELGAVKPSEWVWDTVSLILNTRYNDQRTTIITTNYEDRAAAGSEGSAVARAARSETLGDRIGERMRSRLHEMCRKVELQGSDFRERVRSANIR